MEVVRLSREKDIIPKLSFQYFVSFEKCSLIADITICPGPYRI